MNSRYRINMCRQCRMLKFFPTWACFHLYWASDGCLMQNKPFFTYIMARARYMHEMMMVSVLAHWNNRGDNSLLLLLNTVANTYFNVVFVWTDRDWNSGSTHSRWSLYNHYTTDASISSWYQYKTLHKSHTIPTSYCDVHNNFRIKTMFDFGFSSSCL